MKIFINSSIILLSLFMVGCQNQEATSETKSVKATDASKEDVKSIIDQKNSELEELYRTGNVEKAARYFADYVKQFPPNAEPIIGIENFKLRWKEVLQFGEWNFDFNAQEVKAQGDMAIELGKYTLAYKAGENSPIPDMNDKGNYMVLWEKIDGDWKIVWDVPVSEMPPGGLPDGTEN